MPKPILLTRTGGLRPLASFRERIGLPLAQPRAAALAGSAALPLVYGGKLWEETALLTGDAGVGLRAAATSELLDVPLGRHAYGAASVGEGLGAIARAGSNYCAGQRVWITRVADDVRIQRRFPSELRRGRRQANDFALSMFLDLVRRGAGSHWRPSELHLEGPPPAHAEELAALATHSVHFGAAAETLVVPREVLQLPLPAMRLPATPAAALPDADFAGSVRLAARALLRVGELTLPGLAEVANTSARSLQRRLAVSGLSFARLADEARFEAACRLLRDPGVRITDVAGELGYTDGANFTRAFRRWAGVPPIAFRHGGAR
jgi:AraC-like DNA-binding protein